MKMAANHVYYDRDLNEIVNVCILDLDPGINESVSKGSESYTIWINARSSDAKQKEGFEHAREHIRKGDWEKVYVQQIEAEAHDIEQEESVHDEAYWIALRAAQARHREATKKLENYYKRREKRQKKLAKDGYYEDTIIVDGDYGEPVVKRIIRKREPNGGVL